MSDQQQLCLICFNTTLTNPCPICSDARRDHQVVAVVEEPLDVLALERTGAFDGLYHVLHGAISPVNGIGPDNLKIRELAARVDKGDITEIIVATNPGQEGDATYFYIKKALLGKGVKLTQLARGLPVGGDIE